MKVEILRKQHQKYLRWGIAISLILHLFIFHTSKRFSPPRPVTHFENKRTIIVEPVPKTEYNKQKPPPRPPTVIVESEDDYLPENETIDPFDLEIWTANPPPPPAIEDWTNIFTVVQQVPKPVGGYDAIIDHLVYPELARRSGIQGKVVVAVLIDKYGNIVDTKVEKSLGPGGCDEAAIAAIKAVKWEPALQRDESIKVVIRIPIWFKLAN